MSLSLSLLSLCCRYGGGDIVPAMVKFIVSFFMLLFGWLLVVSPFIIEKKIWKLGTYSCVGVGVFLIAAGFYLR